MPRRIDNPPSPWSTTTVELLEPAPDATLEVYEETARSILSENDSPDVGFRFSVNPYRGCFHGCAYCYARPSHQYLDLGAGTDFERRIVVKVNAPERLERAFERPSWQGDVVAFSGNTDCYQPLEATYGLTRRCLEVCLEYRNPVSIVTKGALVLRDLDLLVRLVREARARVFVSLAFARDEDARALEPWAPSATRRFEVLRALSEAGVPTGIGVAPIIPGINDSQLPEVLERARAAGARWAFRELLRLPAEVKEVFAARLEEAYPLRAGKVLSSVRDMRGGALYRSTYHERMVGHGARWKAVEQLFDAHVRRLGFNREPRCGEEGPTTFRRPRAQGELFDGES